MKGTAQKVPKIYGTKLLYSFQMSPGKVDEKRVCGYIYIIIYIYIYIDERYCNNNLDSIAVQTPINYLIKRF